jgi:hypothetical protein
MSGLSGCREADPSVTSGEFPFRVVFEYQGEIVSVEETVTANYIGHHISWRLVSPRTWDFWLGGTYQNSGFVTGLSTRELTIAVFDYEHQSKISPGRTNTASEVWIEFGDGAYYMGDRGNSAYHPGIILAEYFITASGYDSVSHTMLTFEQAEELFGIRILEWEFSEPIVNSFG